jgi:hypothetical protein
MQYLKLYIVEYFSIFDILKIKGGIRTRENVQEVFRKLFCFYLSSGLPDGCTLLYILPGGLTWGLKII